MQAPIFSLAAERAALGTRSPNPVFAVEGTRFSILDGHNLVPGLPPSGWPLSVLPWVHTQPFVFSGS